MSKILKNIAALAIVLNALVYPGMLSADTKAEKALNKATRSLLKKHINRYNKYAFSRVVKLGRFKTYNQALSGVKIVVDETFSDTAQYDPQTLTVTIKKNPRKVKGEAAKKLGAEIWHELTHRIEHLHGDFGAFDGEDYAERNAYYMDLIVDLVGRLTKLERVAKTPGVSKKRIRKHWDMFVASYQNILTYENFQSYPPDSELMAQWMGFRFDVEKILKLYRSGLAGRMLKNAFTDKDPGYCVEALDPSAIEALFMAGTYYVHVKTVNGRNCAWRAKVVGKPAWVGINNANGRANGSFSIQLSEHQGLVPRKATVQIDKLTIAIEQKPNSFHGTWQLYYKYDTMNDYNSDSVLEFFRNGSLTIVSYGQYHNFGSWSIDGDKVTLEFEETYLGEKKTVYYHGRLTAEGRMEGTSVSVRGTPGVWYAEKLVD